MFVCSMLQSKPLRLGMLLAYYDGIHNDIARCVHCEGEEKAMMS